MLKIFSDGSCKGNGTKDAVGAWAYVVLNNNEEILFNNHDAECGTTNNRMEMTAVLEGIKDVLDYLEDLEVNELPEIEIYTDSAYIHNCLKQKWYENWQRNGWVNSSKQSVKNKDLWELLIPYFENSKFSFHKVKGHADNEWNNYVDKLAQDAADELKGEIN